MFETLPSGPDGAILPAPGSTSWLGLQEEMDQLVEMAWEPGWAPAGLSRLVALCTALRAEAELWPALQASLRAHPLHRLMQEDPLVFHAAAPGTPRASYLDLAIGHTAAAPMLSGTSRAGLDLFTVTRELPCFAMLRARTAFLARMADAVAEQRPGARILSLSAGHLREAASVRHGDDIGTWAVLEPEHPARRIALTQVPAGVQALTMRGSLRGFGRRPFRLGCFDLVMLPRLPKFPAADLRQIVAAAFAVLNPGGRLLVCTPLAPVPEAAWMEAFLETEPRWTSSRELDALLDVVPAAECASRQVMPSLDGHLNYAILRRRG
jgi:SAM-dependent methyltransferase